MGQRLSRSERRWRLCDSQKRGQAPSTKPVPFFGVLLYRIGVKRIEEFSMPIDHLLKRPLARIHAVEFFGGLPKDGVGEMKGFFFSELAKQDSIRQD